MFPRSRREYLFFQLASTNALCVFVFRADQGRFLDYIVSWGNLTEDKLALYLRDILEGLCYLHSWRIAHLDLKVNTNCDTSVGLNS